MLTIIIKIVQVQQGRALQGQGNGRANSGHRQRAHCEEDELRDTRVQQEAVSAIPLSSLSLMDSLFIC